MFPEYPYRNIEDLNLDYIIKTVDGLKEVITAFVSIESVKFADPITWNITTQYAKNTIVLDSEGNAHLSKKPVPAGVMIDNVDYWLEVFNFMDYIKSFNSNLTLHSERNTDRATANYSVNDWLLVDDVLYKVTQAITIDDFLDSEPGGNIERMTIEEFCRNWLTYANNLINQYKNEIDASEALFTSNLQSQFDQLVGSITVDSEVINARIEADTSDARTLGLAINNQINRLSERINELSSLFNWEYDVSNEAISNVDGSISDNVARLITPIIPLKSSVTITIAGNYEFAMAFYSNGVWQTGPSSYSNSTSIASSSSLLDNYDGFRLQIRRSDYTSKALSALDIKNAFTVTGLDIPRKYESNVTPCYIKELGSIPQLQELYMLDSNYKPYNLTARSTQFRLNLKDTNNISLINGLNVEPQFYSDLIQTLVDTVTCKTVGYAILHYDGTEYGQSTSTPWNFTDAAFDLNQSPRIKEYLNRSENIIIVGDSVLGNYNYNALAALLRSKTNKLVYNVAFGGCDMAWRTNDGSAAYDNFSFSNVIESLLNSDYTSMIANKNLNSAFPYRIADLQDIDLTLPTQMIVEYVNNDITGDNPIGNLWNESDTLSDFVRSTVLGAFNYGITELLTNYPHINIIQFTSAWRRMGTPYVAPYIYVNGLGLQANDYNESIKDNADRLGISVYDYFKLGGRNAFNESAYQTDPSHYNAKGYAMVSEIISGIIDSFIQ